METTKTYQLQGGRTFTGTCTCLGCRKALKDEHGNVDYGFRWSVWHNDYVPRECEVAAARRGERG